jgi:hypothetical protein
MFAGIVTAISRLISFVIKAVMLESGFIPKHSRPCRLSLYAVVCTLLRCVAGSIESASLPSTDAAKMSYLAMLKIHHRYNHPVVQVGFSRFLPLKYSIVTGETGFCAIVRQVRKIAQRRTPHWLRYNALFSAI